jgi:hypothetical protein
MSEIYEVYIFQAMESVTTIVVCMLEKSWDYVVYITIYKKQYYTVAPEKRDYAIA